MRASTAYFVPGKIGEVWVMRRETEEGNSKEVREIRGLLEKEASVGQKLLLEQKIVRPDYFLSRLLVCSAKFGSYDLKKLKLVGAALELLELALRKHYGKHHVYRQVDRESSRKLNTQSPYNLRLITGDYYYARAILLVESLGREVVRILARAIASFAGAYAHQNSFSESCEELRPELRKIASLYEASCYLGCFLGDVPKKIADNLIEFGSSIGVVRILKQERLLTLSSEIQENFVRYYFILARKALEKIPEELVAGKELQELFAFEL